jgi:hypothetical protein
VARAGGKRAGTPGKSYANRTDLNVVRAPQTGTQTAASGGVQAPTALPQQGFALTPDQVPKLDDPTARPAEPLTHGLDTGPGGGAETLGVMPGNPAIADIRAAYLRNPTPELRRTLALIANAGMR